MQLQFDSGGTTEIWKDPELRGHLASLSGKRVTAAGQFVNSPFTSLTIDPCYRSGSGLSTCVGERVSDELGIPVQTFYFILLYILFIKRLQERVASDSASGAAGKIRN
jgi:hypothetical protein